MNTGRLTQDVPQSTFVKVPGNSTRYAIIFGGYGGRSDASSADRTGPFTFVGGIRHAAPSFYLSALAYMNAGFPYGISGALNRNESVYELLRYVHGHRWFTNVTQTPAPPSPRLSPPVPVPPSPTGSNT